MDDIELLRSYAVDHSETAFSELVRRHLNFVYRAALRQAGGDTHRARDVAQIVFTLLARKAESLTHHTALTGWLYTTTHLTMSDAFRADRRRRMREQRAQAMYDLSSHDVQESHWDHMRPVLDEALRDLSRIDREAILLRFFRGMPFADVGAKLSLREDTARMRVTRALERLRVSLAKRGIVSTTAAMAALMANEAEAAAPAGFAADVTGTALASAAGGGAAIGLAGIFGIGAILGLLTLGLAIHEFNVSQRARMELAAVNREFEIMSEQLHALDLDVRAAEQTRSELLAKAEASREAALAAAKTWDPVAKGQKFLRAYPQVRAMEIQGNVPTVLRYYAPFLRSANLSPGQVEQLEKLITSTWIDNIAMTPTQNGAIESPTFDQLSEILGNQGAQEYEAYEQNLRYPYEFTTTAAAAAVMAGTPLTQVESDQMAQIIANNTGPYQRAAHPLGPTNLNASVSAVDWEAAIAQIQATLPAAQFSAVQGELLKWQLYGAEVREEQSQAQTSPEQSP